MTAGSNGAGRRQGAKSSAAFRTIGEVAEELDVAQHVLRFWESKFPQIRPLKRAGGRRYYRPEDIETLRVVRELLHEKRYTIEGARKALSVRGQALPDGGEEGLDSILRDLREIRAMLG